MIDTHVVDSSRIQPTRTFSTNIHTPRPHLTPATKINWIKLDPELPPNLIRNRTSCETVIHFTLMSTSRCDYSSGSSPFNKFPWDVSICGIYTRRERALRKGNGRERARQRRVCCENKPALESTKFLSVYHVPTYGFNGPHHVLGSLQSITIAPQHPRAAVRPSVVSFCRMRTWVRRVPRNPNP